MNRIILILKTTKLTDEVIQQLIKEFGLSDFQIQEINYWNSGTNGTIIETVEGESHCFPYAVELADFTKIYPLGEIWRSKAVIVGIENEWNEILRDVCSEKLDLCFFDFENVQEAMDMAIAGQYFLALRLKTMPSNKIVFGEWLSYLKEKIPVKNVIVVHQATADRELGYIDQLNSQGYQVAQMNYLGKVLEKL